MGSRAGTLLISVVLLLAGCGGGTLSASCDAGHVCPVGVCVQDRCAAGDDDEDGDGLSNAYEVAWGLDPARRDSDSDGRFDDEEVGPDPEHPIDTDGDGRVDAAESGSEDADLDCVSDELDPANDVPDASPDLVARAACSHKGVCGEGIDVVTATCNSGVAQCDYSGIPAYSSPEARCDGRDNDCDGKTDEGFVFGGIPVGLACTGRGTCGNGVVECGDDAVSVRCSADPGGTGDASVSEVCDGLDNDCDGDTDEGVTLDGQPVGGPCTADGECGEGVVECLGLAVACSTGPGGSDSRAVPEKCNGLDDDCDGEVDEGATVTGSPADICEALGVCSGYAGGSTLVCRDGVAACDWAGVPGYSGHVESLCDGRDDDCDGSVDEDFQASDVVLGKVPIGGPCGIGACVGGGVVCSADGTQAVCSSHASALPEQCNQVDDDCDGHVDNGLAKDYAAAALVALPATPVTRAGAAIAWSTAVQALFVLGGASRVDTQGTVIRGLPDLWRFDPATHRLTLVAATGPGPRARAVLLADDSASGPGRLLLVGGVVGDSPEDGPLWQFEHASGTWSSLDVPVAQRGCIGAALEPDTRSLRIVRTDTADGVSSLDTVALDTLAATRETVAVPYRTEAAFASRGGILYVHGGRNKGGVPTADLFRIRADGTVEKLDPTGQLKARTLHAMAALDDGSLVVHGGIGPGGEPVSDVVRFVPGADGKPCVLETITPVPSLPLVMPALGTGGGYVWLFSGMQADRRGFRQLLRFDPSLVQWTQVLLEVSPSARAQGTLEVVRSRKQALIIGGYTEDLVEARLVDDLWALSLVDGTFKRISPAGTFPGFVQGATAVDEAEQALYVHGGLSGPPGSGAPAVGRFSRLWLDDGNVNDLGDGGPSPRQGHSLTWTGVAGRLLLYGGRSGTIYRGDVWSFDKKDGWTEISSVHRARAGHTAFWDAATGRLLVVGGTPGGDLSMLDPATGQWTTLVSNPLLDSADGVAFFDPDSRHILVLSGTSGQPLLLRLGDGTAIATVPVLAPPQGIPGAFAGFDPFGRQALLFGGPLADGLLSSALQVLPEICPILP